MVLVLLEDRVFVIEVEWGLGGLFWGVFGGFFESEEIDELVLDVEGAILEAGFICVESLRVNLDGDEATLACYGQFFEEYGTRAIQEGEEGEEVELEIDPPISEDIVLGDLEEMFRLEEFDEFG